MAIGFVLRKIQNVLAIGVTINKGQGSRFNRRGLRARKGDVITIGPNSIVQASLRTDRSPAKITIGSNTQIGANSLIVAAEEVTIGDDVTISWNVTILDHDSHHLDWEYRQHDAAAWARGEKDWTHVPITPVHICDKVYIGTGATIMRGITIGEGAVVGAKSVVTRDVEPWTIVAGNPARFIGDTKGWSPKPSRHPKLVDKDVGDVDDR